MGSEHNHEHVHDTDTYYLDQLCMIGITAAFAGICLTLYYLKPDMLALLLQDQFHIYILIVGFALAFMVLVRAAVLWKAAGQQAEAQAHQHHDHHHHDHGEHCDHHEHDACEHDNGGVATAVRSLPVVEHNHDHDHDHSWAPWRYVVLLVPIMLFLLGLPVRAIPLTTGADVDVTEEAKQATGLIGAGGGPLPQAALAAAMTLQGEGDTAVPINFKDLEQLAFYPHLRKAYEHKKVQVVGQFVPRPSTERVFNISRLRIQCCGADAVQLNVPVICRDNVKGFNKEDWVRVTGRVEFQEQTGRPGVYMTVLVANSRADVARTDPDSRPYIN